jgi:FkbM family methyltransferase
MSGKVSALGRRITNSVLYRTGLRRDGDTPQAAPPPPHRPEPRWVRVEGGPLRGRELLLDPNSPAYWEREMMEGGFDSFIHEAAAAYGPLEGATFWDVGAHIGYHSLCFAALAGPGGRVFSFEPNPHNVERLRLHLERNPALAERITLTAAALSNADGEASFQFSQNIDDGTSSGSHLADAMVPGEPWWYENFQSTPVPTFRADTLLREGRAPAPTVMKIDVEGAEQMVLEGMPELLARVRPLLFIEVHNITQMFHVQRILFKAGYAQEMLDAEHSSVSRCFIAARPE